MSRNDDEHQAKASARGSRCCAALATRARHLEAVGPKDGKPGAALHATIGGFDIWYQTPITGLPYGLQIPGCMILEWADDGRADFSFRAGKWDAVLLRELDKEGVPL